MRCKRGAAALGWDITFLGRVADVKDLVPRMPALRAERGSSSTVGHYDEMPVLDTPYSDVGWEGIRYLIPSRFAKPLLFSVEPRSGILQRS